MAGGSGNRFWPRSRQRVPKQLLPIAGRRSMLADTLARVAPAGAPAAHARGRDRRRATPARVRREARGLPRGNVLVEPEGRNTAAAIALAALAHRAHVARRVMAVLPADHAIGDAARVPRDARARAWTWRRRPTGS